MEITLLGTGCPVAHTERYGPAQVVCHGGALVKSAYVKLVPTRIAPFKLALLKSAFRKLAPLKSARERFTLFMFMPLKLTPARSSRLRFFPSILNILPAHRSTSTRDAGLGVDVGE